MKYPNKLREIRKKTNTSAIYLANLLGVTFQHYYAMERGERQLSAKQIAVLAKSLCVTADDIIDYDPSEIQIEHKMPQSQPLKQKSDDPYFRIMEDAKKNGIPPEDFAMALEFITKFKNREK